jgi:CBS-domain-containing membrane protein
MKVADVMNNIVITSHQNDLIKDLWHKIFIKKINSIPIVDSKNKLVGIVCKDDLLSRLYAKYEVFVSDFETAADFDEMEQKIRQVGNKTAKEVMKTNILHTSGRTHIMRALSQMITHHVNQLPVVTKDNKLIGIVSKGDIFYALFKNRLSLAV